MLRVDLKSGVTSYKLTKIAESKSTNLQIQLANAITKVCLQYLPPVVSPLIDFSDSLELLNEFLPMKANSVFESASEAIENIYSLKNNVDKKSKSVQSLLVLVAALHKDLSIEVLFRLIQLVLSGAPELTKTEKRENRKSLTLMWSRSGPLRVQVNGLTILASKEEAEQFNEAMLAAVKGCVAGGGASDLSIKETICGATNAALDKKPSASLYVAFLHSVLMLPELGATQKQKRHGSKLLSLSFTNELSLSEESTSTTATIVPLDEDKKAAFK